jgi:hypothetical protein
MRTLLIVALVVLSMVLLGWMTFRADGGSAAVEIDTDRAARDTTEAVEAAGDAVNRATDRVKETVDESTD